MVLRRWKEDDVQLRDIIIIIIIIWLYGPSRALVSPVGVS
jgi:hypothetical protein